MIVWAEQEAELKKEIERISVELESSTEAAGLVLDPDKCRTVLFQEKEAEGLKGGGKPNADVAKLSMMDKARLRLNDFATCARCHKKAKTGTSYTCDHEVDPAKIAAADDAAETELPEGLRAKRRKEKHARLERGRRPG